MRKIFEFHCSSCDYSFEELTEYTKTFPCPRCSSNADKLISAPRIDLEGVSGSFPDAARKWDKKHYQKLAEETKKKNS